MAPAPLQKEEAFSSVWASLFFTPAGQGPICFGPGKDAEIHTGICVHKSAICGVGGGTPGWGPLLSQ